ncbi:MAG: helix-turn-helix domain-containing protein [Actinobacteria bacterium]|nr:helix-turn-helix domain-containing protein [Actinomycetota bacterium]MBO0784905.1 helix-turn-helix domain-containing protein [Actinomycetota bacterium]MBO0817006.1 helix-turn-helix domain-containing protein [Actinomycetota bacterium]
MASALHPHQADWQTAALPPDLAELIRPELPSLAEEIVTRIRNAIPEYAQPPDSFSRVLRTSVRMALATFVDLVADPDAPSADLVRLCRRLGLNEARKGRSLDALQAAYRVGAQVSWHRIMELNRRAELSSPVVAVLAEAVLNFVSELASQSHHGYLTEQASSAQQRRECRRRLLALILARPAPSREAVEELAVRAGWTVPRDVTMVAVRAGPGLADRPLDLDVLGELDALEPYLLVPGPLTPRRNAALRSGLAGYPAAAGLTVPLAEAPDSLRWARQALALSRAGIIDGPLARCQDHLVTLWLVADLGLADKLAEQELAALAGLPPQRRRHLTETLAALLETRGSAVQVAERLGVHPQTVRYRIRQLEELLGDRFTDPDARFAMELALRAARLGDYADRPAAPPAVPPVAPPPELPSAARAAARTAAVYLREAAGLLS